MKSRLLELLHSLMKILPAVPNSKDGAYYEAKGPSLWVLGCPGNWRLGRTGDDLREHALPYGNFLLDTEGYCFLTFHNYRKVIKGTP